MKNIKVKKEYPENLLSQVFVNGHPTELSDDVALVLEYIIQKTLTERECPLPDKIDTKKHTKVE